MARVGQLVAHSLQQGHVSEGQRLVCLLGDGCPDSTDLIKVWNVTGEEHVTDVLFNETLTAVVELSIELASARVDEKPIGAAFVIGDTKNVLKFSYQLMIDPFQNHRANIKDRKQWELVKKYAASFDGAFVITCDGIIVAAHRCLNANYRCDIPPGLGTRHHAVAAMTAITAAKGVTVSQEDGLVRVFEKGRIVARIDPNSRVVECFKDSS
jgi:DNA integrity scanning protein DisA with diadenylate cyclase activity